MPQQFGAFDVWQPPVKQDNLRVKIAPNLFRSTGGVRGLDHKSGLGQGLPQKISDSLIILHNQYSSFMRADDFLLELNNTGSTTQRKRSRPTLGGILIEK